MSTNSLRFTLVNYSLINSLIGCLKVIRNSFQAQILFSIILAISLAFLSSVYALQYLRNLHHGFIDHSQQNLKAVMLMESLSKLTDKETIELENIIALTETTHTAQKQAVVLLTSLRKNFENELIQLKALSINGEGAAYIEELIHNREELYKVALHCINLTTQGFPESAVFIWRQTSLHWIEGIRKAVDSFNLTQQQNIIQQLASADGEANMALAWLILLVLIAFFVSAMIGFSISHQLIKPVKELIRSAEGLSGEQIDVHFSLPKNTQMAHLFKTLADNIRAAVEKSKRDGAHTERQKVARDLHDDLAQTLFATNLMAKNARLLLDADTNQLKTCLLQLESLTKEGLANMRDLLHRVREQDIENTSLDVLIARLCDSHIIRTNLHINYHRTQLPLQPAQVQIAFFRIAQEALNNIAKHAHAKVVNVKLYLRDLELHLHVEDDGVGYNPASIDSHKFGLGIMRERAQSLGAVLEIDSINYGGTRVHLVYQQKSNSQLVNNYQEVS